MQKGYNKQLFCFFINNLSSVIAIKASPFTLLSSNEFDKSNFNHFIINK